MPLHDALFVESNPGPVKYAAENSASVERDAVAPGAAHAEFES